MTAKISDTHRPPPRTCSPRPHRCGSNPMHGNASGPPTTPPVGGSPCWTTIPPDRRRCMTSRWSPCSTMPNTPPGWRTRSHLLHPDQHPQPARRRGGRAEHRVAGSLFTLGETLGVPVEAVSRSDSTLRGHVIAEMRPSTLPGARSPAAASTACCWCRPISRPAGSPPVTSTGPGSANRSRSGTPSSPRTPPSATPRPICGNSSPRTAAARSPRIRSTHLVDRHPRSVDRTGSPRSSVGVTGGAWVVVNATDYADLDIVVSGGLAAQQHGKSFVYRCGPSFPRARPGWNRRAR